MPLFEKPGRLSESLLWNLQKRYYVLNGAEAWQSGAVPSHMSTNSFVAWAYAQVIDGFIRDTGTPDSPVTIVEMGAGTGRLAYLITRNLLAMDGGNRAGRFRYIMTDFAHGIIDAWRSASHFQSLLDIGVLGFSQYDADRPEIIHDPFEDNGTAGFAGPVVFIANYVVDSLRQDAFSVVDDALSETRIAASAGAKQKVEDDDFLRNVSLHQESQPIKIPYYGQVALDGILDSYRTRLDNQHFLIPVGMIRCMEALRGLADGPLMTLIGDKGRLSNRDVGTESAPELVLHDGCFSFTANFNALGRYVRSDGGASLFSNDVNRGFMIAALLQSDDGRAFTATTRNFETTIGRTSPRDISEILKTAATIGELPLSRILAYLKLAHFDPNILTNFRGKIVASLEGSSAEDRRRLREILPLVWEQHFPLGMSKDVPYAIANIFENLGDLTDAMQFYQYSREELGDHPFTLYRLARCCEMAGDTTQAQDFGQQALQLDPDYAAPQSLLKRLT